MTRLYPSIFFIAFLPLLLLKPETINGQIIFDNFDSYQVGATTGTSASHWTTWSGTVGGAEDGIVIDGPAFSPPNSMLIAEGQMQDVLLLLGNRSSGRYLLQWMCYIPQGKSAYYNFQQSETPGVAWNLEVFFASTTQGAPSTPGVATIGQTGTTFMYPEDTWFKVSHDVDLDNNLLRIYIDDQLVEEMTYTGNLGAVDFFSINAQNRYFIDDVLFTNTPAMVTFRVDLGNLTPDPAGVFIAGSFTGWSDEAMTNTGGSVYEITKSLDAGTTVQYKFKNGPNGWETAIVPQGDLSGCGVDDGFGNYNRAYTVLGDATLDTVCIGYCVSCDQVSSTADRQLDASLQLFPNPAFGSTTLQYSLDAPATLRLSLFDAMGRARFQHTESAYGQGSISIPLDDLPAGVYTLMVRNDKGIAARKVVVR